MARYFYAVYSTLGIPAVIAYIGAINVILAAINLIPIPPLDGGRVFFALFEAVFGERAKKMATMLIYVVSALLLFQMVYVVVSEAWIIGTQIPVSPTYKPC